MSKEKYIVYTIHHAYGITSYVGVYMNNPLFFCVADTQAKAKTMIEARVKALFGTLQDVKIPDFLPENF